MKWNERIVIDPAVLAGKPVIRVTRLAVEFIVGLLAQGWLSCRAIHNGQERSFADLLFDHLVGAHESASDG